jgi:hypothetical protein
MDDQMNNGTGRKIDRSQVQGIVRVENGSTLGGNHALEQQVVQIVGILDARHATSRHVARTQDTHRQPPGFGNGTHLFGDPFGHGIALRQIMWTQVLQLDIFFGAQQ